MMATRRKQDKSIFDMNNKEKGDSNQAKHSLDGDGMNVLLLFFLYTLQGIPLGLSFAIPMILQNKGVSYKQQAEFSLVQWPFSLKLFWAPIVDSMFIKQIGRRKSWLIPTQYLLGIFMLILSSNIDVWLGKDEEEPQIKILTILFFSLNFLAATQDIVVDGWALTMLKKKNVAYASTCNSVGQTFGYFCGYVLFLALESPEICNYFRSVPSTTGFVTLAGFFYFWGLMFLIATTIIAVIKRESEYNDPEYEHVHEQSLRTAYSFLVSIIKLPAIQTLALVLLTYKIGFSSTDSVFSLKLIESGIPREKLGLLAIPLIPVQLILPIIISKYTHGPQPMDMYIKYVPYRLVFGLLAAGIVHITPIIVINNEVPMYYYGLLILCYCLHQICVYSMFVAVMAFFNRVSDPTVGGTYMTLLNTLSNLGGNWPQTLALWLIDPLTYKTCVPIKKKLFRSFNYEQNTCKNHLEMEECQSNGGKCVTIIDGFYVETVVCVLIGVVWLFWGIKKIKMLQQLPEKSWRIHKSKSDRLWRSSSICSKKKKDVVTFELKKKYEDLEPEKNSIISKNLIQDIIKYKDNMSDTSDDVSDITNSVAYKRKFNFKTLCSNTFDRMKSYKSKRLMKNDDSDIEKIASEILRCNEGFSFGQDLYDSESSTKSFVPEYHGDKLKKRRFYKFFKSSRDMFDKKPQVITKINPKQKKIAKKKEINVIPKQLIPKENYLDISVNNSRSSFTTDDDFDYTHFNRSDDYEINKQHQNVVRDRLITINNINNICNIQKLQQNNIKRSTKNKELSTQSSSEHCPKKYNFNHRYKLKTKKSFSDTDIALIKLSFGACMIKNYYNYDNKYIQCESQSSVDTGIQVCINDPDLIKNTTSSDVQTDDSELNPKKSLLHKMFRTEISSKIPRTRRRVFKKRSEIKILHSIGKNMMSSSTSLLKTSSVSLNSDVGKGNLFSKSYLRTNKFDLSVGSGKIIKKVLKPTTIVVKSKKTNVLNSNNRKCLQQI